MPDATMPGAAASPAPRTRSGRGIQWGVALVTVVLVGAPLLPLCVQALWSRPLYDGAGQVTTGNFVRLLGDPAFGRAAANSLLYAVLATVVAQAAGSIVALLVARTDLPGRGMVGGLFVWPLFLSQLVVAFGWLIVYGPAGYVTLAAAGWLGAAPWNLYTVPGMALVDRRARQAKTDRLWL